MPGLIHALMQYHYLSAGGSVDAGVIAGGVVGGMVGVTLVILLIVILLLVIKKRKTDAPYM